MKSMAANIPPTGTKKSRRNCGSGIGTKQMKCCWQTLLCFSQEARSAIHHPGGHNEGWPDALKKNGMLNFYTFIREGKDPLHDQTNFATFEDGHISMCITDAILESHQQQKKWVKVQVGQEALS
ncbi:hypothetical protein GCM10020331_008930 [Ectobacillus funiculus]